MVAILLLATALRSLGLTVVPPGPRYDELLNAQMAERVVDGDRPLYFTESWGHEPLFHYLQAGSLALLGRSVFALRLPAVLLGLLSVLTLWLAARRLFGPRVALLAAGSLAVSFWSVFYSRQGLRVIGIAPLVCLMIYFLWRGLEPGSGRIVDVALGGVTLGLLFYIYMAARVLPGVVLGLALYLAVAHRRRLKVAWWKLFLLLVVALLIGSPLFWLLYRTPELEERADQMLSSWRALQAGDLRPILRLVARALGMFVWRGQADWLYNVSGRPVLDPLAGIGFLVGLGVSIWRWRETRYALAVIWLVVGLVPAMVMPPAASLPHAISAQPPTYLLLAVGLATIGQWIGARWPGAAPILLAGVVTFHGALGGYAYFITWAAAPEVEELYQGGITAVADELDESDLPGPVAIGAPYVNYWHHWNILALELSLRREELSVRWFDPSGAWVWPESDRPVTYYFPVDPLGPQAFEPALESLFRADAALLPPGDERFSAFRAERFSALGAQLASLPAPTLAWPPGLEDVSPPTLPIDFDGRVALVGVDAPEGPVAAGGRLSLITYWQVLASDLQPLVTFVHLTPDGEAIWGQSDWLDVWAESLEPGDRFAQVHTLPVQPDTPVGRYHVQIGLYHPETLARLPIIAGEGERTDRIWVAEVVVEGQ